MADVEQYKSGQAALMVKKSVEAIQAAEQPLAGSERGKKLLTAAAELEPLRLSLEQAAGYIQAAEHCAVGERVCRCEFPGSPLSEAVFLDDLALGMAQVGKARLVDKQQAIEALASYKGRPIVMSKVAGKYQEICRTWPQSCVYWNLAKKGLRCLRKPAS